MKKLLISVLTASLLLGTVSFAAENDFDRDHGDSNIGAGFDEEENFDTTQPDVPEIPDVPETPAVEETPVVDEEEPDLIEDNVNAIFTIPSQIFFSVQQTFASTPSNSVVLEYNGTKTAQNMVKDSTAGKTTGAYYNNAKINIESYGVVDYDLTADGTNEIHIAAEDIHRIAAYLDKLYWELEH